MNRRTCWMFALGMALAAPSLTFAQNRGGGGGDPAQFRQMMLDRTKEQLGASADEWQVLQPKIEKLMTAQRDAMMSRGGFGGGNRRGGGDRNGGNGGQAADSQPQSPTQTASRELRDALDNKETPPDQIAAKLKTLREARAKAKASLEAAQKDLQGVLTPRQEAVLVASGMLD